MPAAAGTIGATPTTSGGFPRGASRAAALDLHEGISDPRAGRGCQRWPEGLHLLNESTGELVRGRCRATNLCLYCRTLGVIETAEMLQLDALEQSPTLYSVLTAREHLTRRDTHRHLEQLRKAVRRVWGASEWHVSVEFQKRGALHLNLLHKGVPGDELEELHALLVDRWCARVDALPCGQLTKAVHDAGGLSRYLAKQLVHGLKAEQAPPLGWKGHRTSQTRGYLVRPASVMREEARESLRRKRLLWRAEQGGGDVEQLFEQLVAASDATTWRFVKRREYVGALRWSDTGKVRA
jgi:hypothetical protein